MSSFRFSRNSIHVPCSQRFTDMNDEHSVTYTGGGLERKNTEFPATTTWMSSNTTIENLTLVQAKIATRWHGRPGGHRAPFSLLASWPWDRKQLLLPGQADGESEFYPRSRSKELTAYQAAHCTRALRGCQQWVSVLAAFPNMPSLRKHGVN